MQDIGSLNTNSGFRMTLSIHFSYNKEIILPSNDTSNQIFKYSTIPLVVGKGVNGGGVPP